MIPIQLDGKTAIVTGAGRGLGAAIATKLHHAGANVAVNYFEEGRGENRALAEQVVDGLGERAVAIDADVRDVKAVESMVSRAIAHFGALQIVVNNAGIIRDRTLLKMTADEWQDVIDTNLSGVFHVCQQSARRMSDGGAIVNVASISAVMGAVGQANYASSKAGVMAMTHVLARELAKYGILVNAVAPGLVLTEMGLSIPESNREEMVKQIPLQRCAEPDEIAGVVLFLCSHLASYVNGQTIHVNGGWWS